MKRTKSAKMLYCSSCGKLKEKKAFKKDKNGSYYKTCIYHLEKKRQYDIRHKDQILLKKRLQRENDPNKKEKSKARHRKTQMKLTIGRAIKQEANFEPSHHSKSLWNGIGNWNNEYYECVECNTTLYKHKAGGVCRKCYRKLYYENNHMKEKDRSTKYRIKNKEKVQKVKSEWRRKQMKQAEKYIELAKKGEIPKTPKIKNLLSHLDF